MYMYHTNNDTTSGQHAPVAVYRAMVFNKPAASGQQERGGTTLPWHQDGGDWCVLQCARAAAAIAAATSSADAPSACFIVIATIAAPFATADASAPACLRAAATAAHTSSTDAPSPYIALATVVCLPCPNDGGPRRVHEGWPSRLVR